MKQKEVGEEEEEEEEEEKEKEKEEEKKEEPTLRRYRKIELWEPKINRTGPLSRAKCLICEIEMKGKLRIMKLRSNAFVESSICISGCVKRAFGLTEMVDFLEETGDWGSVLKNPEDWPELTPEERREIKVVFSRPRVG